MTQQVRNLLDEYGKVLGIISLVLTFAFFLANSYYTPKSEFSSYKEQSLVQISSFKQQVTEMVNRIESESTKRDNDISQQLITVAAEIKATNGELKRLADASRDFQLSSKQYQDTAQERFVDVIGELRQMNLSLSPAPQQQRKK